MRKFIRGFGYAFAGICHAFKTERNLRFHLTAAIIVSIAALLTGFSPIEWTILFILFGGMFALEIMNTAVERAVDLVTSKRHPLARQAKDLAAGAVLVFAIVSVIIGLLLFIPKWFT